MSGAGEHSTGYRAYARAHGMSPDEMLAHDMQRWPGGCMAGFIIWIGGQKAAFRMAHPEAFVNGVMNPFAFTAWLKELWLKESR